VVPRDPTHLRQGFGAGTVIPKDVEHDRVVADALPVEFVDDFAYLHIDMLNEGGEDFHPLLRQHQITTFMSMFMMSFTGTWMASTMIIGAAAASTIGAAEALPNGTVRMAFTAW